MFFHKPHVFRILLIVGERHTQDIRLGADVGQQGTTSQFDIVWMRSKEEKFLPEEVHPILPWPEAAAPRPCGR